MSQVIRSNPLPNRDYFKLITWVNGQIVKYVFVGEIPEEVQMALNGGQITASREVIVETYFGPKWRDALGISGRKEARTKDNKLEHRQTIAPITVFITAFLLRPSDTLRMVRQKICLACHHHGFYLRPEWQHLFTASDNLSTHPAKEGTVRPSDFSVDPRQEVGRLMEATQLSDTSASRKDVQYFMLDDFAPIRNNEIFLIPVSALVPNLCHKYGTWRDVPKAFQSIYFPDCKNWADALRGTLDYHAEGRREIPLVRQFVAADEIINTTLDELPTSNIVRTSIRDVEVEVDDDKRDQLDLGNMFGQTGVNRNLILISLRGLSREDLTRHKLRKDIQLVEKDLDTLRQWLLPAEPEAKRLDILFLRSLDFEGRGVQMSLELFSSGLYRIFLKWTAARQARLHDVATSVTAIRGMVKQLIATQAMPTAPLHHAVSENAVSEMTVRAMQIEVVFPCTNPFSYTRLNQLARCFQTYVTISDETGELGSFWDRYAQASATVAKLVRSNLFGLPALAGLGAEEWRQMRLFDDANVNARLVQEFRSKVTSLTKKGMTLYFIKHSRYNSPTLHKNFINGFLNDRKLTVMQAKTEPKIKAALIQDLHKRLNISQKDARQIYSDYFETGDVDLRSQKVSAGPKCRLKQKGDVFKLSISNIRNFTDRSSVEHLAQDIIRFFSKLLTVYNLNEIEKFCAAHQGICASSPLVTSTADVVDQSVPNVYNSSSSVRREDAMGNPAATTGWENEDDDDDDDDDDLDAISDGDKDLLPKNTSGPTIPPSSRLEPVLGKMAGQNRLAALKSLDPEIFGSNERPGFASRCKVVRQPVVLSPQEYGQQDLTTFKIPKALDNGFQYRGNFYACPAIWCPSMRRAVHEKDLHDIKRASGAPSGEILSARCPDGELADIATSGLGGWNATGPGGRFEYPGFLDFKVKEHYVPCCFGLDQSVGKDAAAFFSRLNDVGGVDKVAKANNHRYLLGPSKTPVEEGRFGRLIPSLERFFNGDVDDKHRIYDAAYSRYLRVGVSQGSFLNALVAVINLSSLELSFVNASAFRTFLASRMTDDLLFRSLKNGNLKVIFEDFPGDDYLAKFRHYLEFECDPDMEFIWDLVCRPLPWLFREGLNLFILHYDAKTDRAELKCPKGEIINSFYASNRQGAFLVTDGTYYEPVARVDNGLRKHVMLPFGKSLFWQERMLKLMNNCNEIPDTALVPSNVIKRLRQGTKGLQPVAQIMNAYNKVRYILTANRIIIPVEQGFGPVLLYGLPLLSVDKMPSMTCRQFHDQLPALNKLFGSSYQPVKVLMDETGEPAALRLVNARDRQYDFVVPVKCRSGEVSYPIDEQWLFRDIDDDIFDSYYIEDERVRLVSEYQFLRESLIRYRRELAQFLMADIKRPDGRRQKRYLIQIKNVLDSKDRHGHCLPIASKRAMLERIFHQPPGNALVDQLVSTQKHMTNKSQEYIQPTARNLCSSAVTDTMISCNSNPHCAWNSGKDKPRAKSCQFYLPKRHLVTLTSLVIDELLRDTVGKEMILQNRFQILMRNKRIEITADYILFDDSIADFVLQVMQNFDLRVQKQRAVADYAEAADSARNPLQTLKKNLLFRAFMKFPQQPLGRRAKLTPVPAREGLFYTETSNSLFNTVAYVVSHIMNRPNFVEDQVRQDLVRYLNSKKRWQSYLSAMRELAPHYAEGVTSFAQLAQFIETSDFGGCHLDVPLLNAIYPIHFRVLTPKKTQTKPMSDVQASGKVVDLFALSPFDLRLIYHKTSNELSFSQA